MWWRSALRIRSSTTLYTSLPTGADALKNPAIIGMGGGVKAEEEKADEARMKEERAADAGAHARNEHDRAKVAKCSS